jgi:hypothetical protein
MGRPVERGQLGGYAAGDLRHAGRLDHPVQEPGGHGIGRGERLREDRRPVEVRGRKALRQISTAALGLVRPMATSFAVIL